VELNLLPDLYREANAWPKTQADLDRLAEKIARLFEAPFVVILTPDSKPGPAIGIYSKPGIFNSPAEHDQWIKFLKKESGKLRVDPYRVSYLTVDVQSQIPVLVPHLGLVAIPGVAGTDGISKTGWIAVGTEKALNPRDEAFLAAVAQRLAELARVDDLENTIKLQAQFMSIASHELKTPLTSIYGILQLQERMLRQKKPAEPNPEQERQHSFLKMVIRQVERLNELIDALLDVSRIQNGRFVVEPAMTDVVAILRDVSSNRLAVIAQESGVKIEVDSPESMTAWVDPVRMEEVVNNLVMNAIRFSPEGGVVRVGLREEPGNFRVTVRDQGPAVPPEDRERIFQPFERAQRTGRLGGLGLGLFISRQIAQLHGGNVSLVESVPGKGNVFEAYFPRRNVSLISA